MMVSGDENNDRETAAGGLEAGTVVNHYRIVEKIGSGGMGEVYLAEDGELGRQVALKFLPVHYISDESFKERFQREAQAAAALDHPNIITVYEVGEYQQRPFFAMQYVKGESLTDFIKNRELALNAIIGLAIEICRGLAKAHEAQITHRDIKPSNILVDADGHPKLLDFGLATIHGSKHLTKTGSTIGTAIYMSPEQAQGHQVDQRADLFSFGVVFYEMITGRTPFDRGNMVATVQAVVSAAPEPLARYRANVPDNLQRITTKLLQKNRDIRYQHADDLLADLKTSLRALESGVSENTERQIARQPSIAVLPFSNLSADEEQDYFCEGIAEEIIKALTRVKGLQVAARTSAFAFKGKNEDMRDIGWKLNVETLLEGSVRKAGNRLRISAQLINVADGYHLWSERYDRELEDVFAIQDEISENIVKSLRIILSDDERQALTRAATADVKAYDYYLRGRRFYNQGRQINIRFARQMFTRALEVDPEYALAYAGVADCCSSLVHWYGETDEATIEQAIQASQKALELDPVLAEVRAARGFALWLARRNEEAFEEFETAIRLDPNQFDARYYYGRACFQQGEFAKAAQLFEDACQVREDHEAWFFAGQTYIAMERPEEALTAYRKATNAVEKYMELNPDDARAVTIGAVSLCRIGEIALGLEWAERATTIDPQDAGIRYNVACMFAVEGEKDKALDYLEQAARSGFGNREWVEKDPDLISLRGDPRFQAIRWGEASDD